MGVLKTLGVYIRVCTTFVSEILWAVFFEGKEGQCGWLSTERAFSLKPYRVVYLTGH